MSNNSTNVGKLFLNNKLFKEHAEIEFEDDVFSNKKRIGTFKVDYVSAEFENNFFHQKYKFKFYDNDNILYLGRIIGHSEESQIYSRITRLKFILYLKQQHVKWRKSKCKKILIYFGIPFCNLLCRDTRLSHGFDPDYIIKYREKPFTISAGKTSIVFDDSINLLDINKSKGEMKRFITPTFSLNSVSSSKLYPKLNSIEDIMTDTMTILTFYFNHKFDWYSYTAQLLDENDKVFEFVKYKDYLKNMGSAYEFEDPHMEFRKYMNTEILSSLITKYRALHKKDKKIFDSFVNDLAELKGINSKRSRRSIALFLIESICNYLISKFNIQIISNPRYSDYQEKIKGVIEYFRISDKEIKFSYSNIITKTKKRLWHITYYRNSFAHWDNNLDFNSTRLENEYIKVLKLIRMLLFTMLEPKYREIPYPKIFV